MDLFVSGIYRDLIKLLIIFFLQLFVRRVLLANSDKHSTIHEAPQMGWQRELLMPSHQWCWSEGCWRHFLDSCARQPWTGYTKSAISRRGTRCRRCWHHGEWFLKDDKKLETKLRFRLSCVALCLHVPSRSPSTGCLTPFRSRRMEGTYRHLVSNSMLFLGKFQSYGMWKLLVRSAIGCWKVLLRS